MKHNTRPLDDNERVNETDTPLPRPNASVSFFRLHYAEYIIYSGTQ